MDNFFVLLALARKGALSKKINSSTTQLSKELFVSQQSISRKLRELKEENLVEFSSSPSGITISISDNGKKELSKTFGDLQKIFFGTTKKEFLGTVQTGLGEGKYYLSFPQYQKQILEKIGFTPFPGTLNLKVNEHDLAFFKQDLEQITVNGFATKERTFGGLKAYKVLIDESIKGAIVFPDRSNNPAGIAELIAPVFLRKKLDLKDQDQLKVSEGQT